MVKIGVWNVVDEDVIGAHHACKFAGCENNVHIRVAAGVAHWFQRCFFFLGEAWHDGDHADFVRVDTDGIGEIGFCDGAKHLHWRFRRGKVVGHLRKVGFQETHPTRTAGCEHRPLVLVAVGEAFDEFAGFFHDREIGAEVGVKDIVEADLLEGADHFRCRENVAVDAEFFCPGNTHGRCHLHNGDGIGIGQCREHFFRVIAFMQRACWAMGDALAAEGAIRFADAAVVADVDCGAGTGAGNVPDVEALDLVADLDAAHAFDAFGGIADEWRRFVPVERFNALREWVGEDALFVGDALQLAVAVADAGWAVAVVLRKNELQIGAASLAYARTVGVNDHAFHDFVGAGRQQAVDAFHLNDAHAAGGDFVEPFPIAEAWHRMPGDFRSFEDGGAVRHRQLDAVDRDIYHFVCLPPLKMP